MSYWLYITPGKHPDCKADHNSESMNCTSNVSPVWAHAGFDMSSFDAKPAKEFLPQLREAIEKIKADPGHYDQFVRGGGTWGSVASALATLEWLESHAARDENAILTVSH